MAECGMAATQARHPLVAGRTYSHRHSAIRHSAILIPPFPNARPLDQALRDHPLLAIPALFGAGLVTSLTPCVTR
jgi:hypothetical protein